LIYADTINGTCTCYGCWTASDCSQTLPNCSLDLTLGEPGVITEFWAMNHQANVRIVTDYRTFYQSYIPALLPAIQQLHTNAGNCNFTNKNFVIGYGANQLISAAIWALYQKYGSHISVFTKTPYSPDYPIIANFDPYISSFNPSLDQPAGNVVEIVTYPNNPDGELRTPIFPNSSFVIYDMTYYWPSFSLITNQANYPLTIWTTTVASGHAGSRLGWAWVSDPVIASYMNTYIVSTTLGVSVDSQDRMLNIYNYINIKNLGFFAQINQAVSLRWGQIINIFTNQPSPNRFSLANKVLSGFYLWVLCNFPADAQNCAQVFLNGTGVSGIAGPSFGANSSYVRFNFAHFSFLTDAAILSFQNFLIPLT